MDDVMELKTKDNMFIVSKEDYELIHAIKKILFDEKFKNKLFAIGRDVDKIFKLLSSMGKINDPK